MSFALRLAFIFYDLCCSLIIESEISFTSSQHGRESVLELTELDWFHEQQPAAHSQKAFENIVERVCTHLLNGIILTLSESFRLLINIKFPLIFDSIILPLSVAFRHYLFIIFCSPRHSEKPATFFPFWFVIISSSGAVKMSREMLPFQFITSSLFWLDFTSAILQI